ncbi:MAG: hypothetical protein AAGL68_01800 [Pseudomonadota bacterium]
MISISFLAALTLAQSAAPPATSPAPPAQEAEAQLTSENRAVLRCSAAFALVSHGQANGNEDAKKWPELTTRGREFFVRALAGIMDDTGLDREGVSQLVSAEAQRLWDEGSINDVMPACLMMLETSGV